MKEPSVISSLSSLSDVFANLIVLIRFSRLLIFMNANCVLSNLKWPHLTWIVIFYGAWFGIDTSPLIRKTTLGFSVLFVITLIVLLKWSWAVFRIKLSRNKTFFAWVYWLLCIVGTCTSTCWLYFINDQVVYFPYS
jgi:hypothetical protein